MRIWVQIENAGFLPNRSGMIYSNLNMNELSAMKS